MKKGKMLILVGASASGKSSLQKELEKFGIKKVVTYTTRPMRTGEINGVDYHFVSEDKFREMVQDGAFAEHASYRGWHYGTALSDCGYQNTSAALTPAGLRSLNRKGVPNFSVYLNVDRRSRLIKILQRGDDIEEAYRRNLSDVGQFDEIDKETDIELHNEEYKNSLDVLAIFVSGVYKKELEEN